MSDAARRRHPLPCPGARTPSRRRLGRPRGPTTPRVEPWRRRGASGATLRLGARLDKTVREAPSGRRLLLLTAVVGLGVAVRVAYVLVVLDPVPPGLDAIWYQLQGGSIRNGTGYVVPTSLFRPEQVPTAAFPPAYPVYQAVWQSIFGDGPTSVRLAGMVPATATIALVGLLSRRLVGPGAGLLAAGVVALDPSLVAMDGSAMSENLAVPVVLAIVVVAHRLLVDGVRPHRFVLVGVLSGVAVLTRQDLFLLLVLVCLPAVAWDGAGWLRRVGAVAMVVAVTATVVVPWAWRNEREVGVFAVSTLSPSSALAGSNCDDTYAGPVWGAGAFPVWSLPSRPASPVRSRWPTRSSQRGSATCGPTSIGSRRFWRRARHGCGASGTRETWPVETPTSHAATGGSCSVDPSMPP